MNFQRVVALTAALAIAANKDCWAWGAIGHEWISGIAVEKLPDSVPQFIRTPEAAAEIAVMGRELDRSKGAGKTHDSERDSGHFVDLADDGAVMGVLPLAELPDTREHYDTLLRGQRHHSVQGRLPAVFDRRWLATDTEGLRLLARR